MWLKNKLKWQIHIHGIFAVQNCISLIAESWCEELYKYIANQPEHHKKRNMVSEYIDFLKNVMLNMTKDIFLNRLNDNHIPSLTGRTGRGAIIVSTNILSLYLRQMAFLDFLTNLPNFNSLKKRHLAQIQIWKFDRF